MEMAMISSLATYPVKYFHAWQAKARKTTVSASKSRSVPIKAVFNSCRTCRGKGAVECPGCKGTGKNKKNGNIFERWKCFECQGFGMKSCPNCGKGGLTPEQRGER
ncbi:protein PHOTOSYSTEM I ASSEMBLY 2, chloroplastic [Phoenix dactylifera]|uniref:Protein PHOTOSYSTEM I ASSEMBLY 2, chloroplastic n=1 Tax=Phoenix dactylifera TaxID=42345 RepID=A0A8B7BVZ9_PHODC|nr:protein PHOTOSYSTEM I ASSEMBLY 2, chloroplastic [Phoenix dactylifera]